jgi:hypothetical protein
VPPGRGPLGRRRGSANPGWARARKTRWVVAPGIFLGVLDDDIGANLGKSYGRLGCSDTSFCESQRFRSSDSSSRISDIIHPDFRGRNG